MTQKIILFLLISASMVFAQQGKKLLYIDSYHEGYAWSDAITNGIKKNTLPGVELKVFRMDTKRKSDESSKVLAGIKAIEEISRFRPDVVIVSDDNAVKYVVVPYITNQKKIKYQIKDSANKEIDQEQNISVEYNPYLPFIFCGINWDASKYNLPKERATGMLEVSLYDALIVQLDNTWKSKNKGVSRKIRYGFISADNETEKKEKEQLSLLITLDEVVFVKTFDEWATEFQKLQNKVDILFFINNAGISNWDDEKAAQIVTRENLKSITGSIYDFMSTFVLITYAKLGEEQGEWSAKQAMAILKGKQISEIPVSKNQRGMFYINLNIAKKIKVFFPIEFLQIATLIK